MNSSKYFVTKDGETIYFDEEPTMWDWQDMETLVEAGWEPSKAMAETLAERDAWADNASRKQAALKAIKAERKAQKKGWFR